MPDLIHDHAADWIAAALADGLTPDERRTLDAHLTGCASCRVLQTELTATHEMLSQDLPSAVGPLPGFETRLLVGLRCGQERDTAGVRLRAPLAGLLRLPGLRVAGAAAALLALVGLGQMLTSARRVPFGLPRSAVFSVSGQLNKRDAPYPQSVDDTAHAFDLKLSDGRRIAAANTKDKENFDGFINYGNPINTPSSPSSMTSPEVFAGSVPVGDIDTGRDVVVKFGDTSVSGRIPDPVFSGSFDNRSSSSSSRPQAQTDHAGIGVGGEFSSNAINQPAFETRTLSGANTYTGSTTVNGGTLNLSTANGSIGTLAKAGESNEANGFGLGVIGDKAIRREISPAPADALLRPDSTAKPAALGDVPLVGHLFVQTAPTTPVPPSTTPAPVTVPAGPAPVSDTPAPAATPDARKLIRNASAELEVASFEQTVAALASAAAQDGGFIDTQNSARSANGKLAGTLVVKTLPENLDRFLARLPSLGEVKNQTIKTEDITKDYFDTEARLRNSRRMEDRLLKMLEEVKGKMSEVLAVEKEIARVRGDIEQMQGELKLYDSQVRLATVSLSVYEKDLHQPAAFLLRETASLALATGDVEKTAADARRLAESAHAQILSADVNRAAAGHVSATLRLLLVPDTADAVLAQFKALGRVENFTVQDERVAQNGSGNDAGPDSAARTERAPVSLSINIRHDEQASRQVSLTLVAPDVGAAFDRARAAATSAGGDITQAETIHADATHAQASLTVRLPARTDAAFLDTLKTLGRITNLQTRRAAENPDDGPVLVTLALADAEPPVQQTRVRVRAAEVERRLAEIKTQAAATGATVENSTFSREGDDSESATLTIRLPLGAYPGFVERVRALGEVKDFAVRRQDRPGDASVPAQIDLQLFREGRVVAETAGVGATVRRTFAQGADALMWSVQMIGVALAFLAPWAALLAVAGAAWWLVRRRSRS